MVLCKRGEVDGITAMSSYNKHYQPEERSGVCVVRRSGENDEDFIKRFRKKFSKSGVAKELRERMYFEKPSNKKRRKKAQSIRLMKREEEKAKEMRERYKRMKAKQKRKRDKENKRKGAQHDQSSGRQNSGGVSQTGKE